MIKTIYRPKLGILQSGENEYVFKTNCNPFPMEVLILVRFKEGNISLQEAYTSLLELAANKSSCYKNTDLEVSIKVLASSCQRLSNIAEVFLEQNDKSS